MSAEKYKLADERAKLMAEKRAGYPGRSKAYIESQHMYVIERLAVLDKLIGRL